ncbi:winged helix-turn-helix domain-containing protein [Amycolatopsis jiangsuensis]|uniref:DNA-binding response OmpR family regulator n=1 Tax=Amycolatopsis jiangsuensis TaxID=1181879 RepID=A0A840J7C0_9PSEU|nr:response regulator transcription factor [Amycolatopsis jiangsuensis]MBB4689609.1 DNA-binding response OmpR family regulator [Amycolatopsis jiangsuensis]
MTASVEVGRSILAGGRYPVPGRPVVVATAGCADIADELVRSGEARGWRMVFEKDLERVNWAVNVHRAAALVLVADDAGWVVRFVSAFRAMSAIPIVVVADVHKDAVVAALATGVDTVLPPVVASEEVLARTYAIIRRGDERLAPTTRYLLAGRLSVDVWRRRAHLGECDLKLTSTEFDLLSHLMRQPERILAPQTILSQVWGFREVEGLNTLRIFIGRLRGKLGDTARRATYIQSVRGHGYRFAVPVVEVPDEERAGLADEPGRGWLEALAKISSNLGRARDDAELAQKLVDGLVGAGVADGIAVHHVDRGRLQVRAHRGMSETWLDGFGDVALSDDGLASSRAVLTGRPVQVPQTRSYRSTTTALKSDNFRAGLFLPIAGGPEGTILACLGLVHRDVDAHRPSTLSFAVALCAVYGAQLAAREFTVGRARAVLPGRGDPEPPAGAATTTVRGAGLP